ncbi:MAG TPA: glycosyltransferase [Paludibacteraceae bacterium]|nr:glycosyltransferase [Paludibacteraceae bacterium]
MPKISVIIPVYNAAETIVRCINSLLCQTLDDMEFILVDDHGQDNSIEIVKQHIAGHTREKQFIFTETSVNSGPGVARNMGIKLAQGEYVAFVDADDWLEKDMLETLLTAAKQKHTDMAYCHAWEHKANKMCLLKSVTFRSNKQFLSQFVARLWTILFRRDFLLKHNINFPLTRSAEDSCMIAAAIMQASSIVFVDKPLYHYIVYSVSVSHKRDKQRIAQKYASFSWLFKYAKETGLYDFYYCQLWWIYFKKVVLVTLFK